MAFDLNKWLTKDMGFTDAEATELAPKFTAERAEKLAKGYTNTAEYQSFRAQLEDTNTRLNAEIAEWAEVKGRDTEAANTRLAEIENLRADKTRLETRLTEIATRAGIKPEDALKGITPEPEKKSVETPAIDPTKFVDRAHLGEVVSYLYNLTPELLAIQADHQALYGTPMTGAEIKGLTKAVTERVAKKQPADVRAIWEETFQVPAKREAVRVDKYNADITAAEARGAERVRSEQAIPTAHPTGSHAPIFKRPEGDTGSKLQRPQPGRSTLTAAEALRSGKYRTPVTAGAGR